MTKLGAFGFLLFVSTGYATDRLQPVEVSGLSVPGTPALAKELRFTNCSTGYDKYDCSRTVATKFYGVTAERAQLSIDGKDNFSPDGGSSIAPKISDVPPEKLTYRSISLEFHLDEREALQNALLKDGWLKSGSLNTFEFLKEGIGASIKFHRSSTTLSPKDVSEVNQQIAGLKAKAAEAAETKASSASFIDSMKN